jgi:hypothetical protein
MVQQPAYGTLYEYTALVLVREQICQVMRYVNGSELRLVDGTFQCSISCTALNTDMILIYVFLLNYRCLQQMNYGLKICL